jgi:pyruvate/2-oxoglutarate/acetoin dehydrogenase E1 component
VATLSVARITQGEAIAEALRIEMGRDPSVCLVERRGSTIARGFDQLFSEDRVVVLDAAERTMIGMAVGMALEGWRPVCEVSAAELPSRGLDQLAEATGLHRREGTPVPIVIRVPCGGDAGSSDDPDGPERWLLSIPDLRVVAPSTPADAKGLLASAIRDPGPVCVLEQAVLADERAAVPEGTHTVPIGEARVVREGHRATILAYGPAVGPASDAAATLDAGVEVLDLRTLAPLDVDGIVKSVRETGKALIVEETPSFSTVSHLVTGAIWDGAFEYLDAPLRRVSLADPSNGDGGHASTRIAAIGMACNELLAY